MVTLSCGGGNDTRDFIRYIADAREMCWPRRHEELRKPPPSPSKCRLRVDGTLQFPLINYATRLIYLP